MARIDLRPKHLIILDAGHGIETAGKRSPVWADGRQLLEYDFNRDLARRIKEGLDALGYDARLLVPEADDLPMLARIRRARDMVEEHKGLGGIAPNRVLVSIHANASGKRGQSESLLSAMPSEGGVDEVNASGSLPQPLLKEGGTDALNAGEAGLPPFGGGRGEGLPLTPIEEEAFRMNPSGWECFVNAASWNSRHIGELLLKHAVEKLPDRFPIRGAYGNLRTPGMRPEAKVAKFAIIKNAPCIAVLTENLFMDCKKDCEYLFTEEGRDTLAQIHIDALDENFAHNMD